MSSGGPLIALADGGEAALLVAAFLQSLPPACHHGYGYPVRGTVVGGVRLRWGGRHLGQVSLFPHVGQPEDLSLLVGFQKRPRGWEGCRWGVGAHLCASSLQGGWVAPGAARRWKTRTKRAALPGAWTLGGRAWGCARVRALSYGLLILVESTPSMPAYFPGL